MLTYLTVNRAKKRIGLQIFFCLFVTGFFLVTGIPTEAQYPYIIEMSHKMIGKATIVARQEIIHKPGFEAKEGLEYHAYIDPNFAGNGTAYNPPPDPGDRK